jgi:broad specificity phosphatase PhoE
MYLLFIRHLESEKNLNNSFASFNDDEPLTEAGKAMGEELGDVLSELVKNNNINIKNIYSASSKRGLETAQLLANKLKLPIVSFDELCSSRTGSLQGKSEEEVQKENPNFIKQLELYRKGLLSSYEFEIIEGKESKASLEKRVMDTVNNIINDIDEDLKIVIFHRSSLTACLINYARESYSYPKDFFGFIKLDCGNVTLLTNKYSNRNWSFECVNDPAIKLKKIDI